MENIASPLEAVYDSNFAVLESRDEYAVYFNQLCVVFQRLLGCYATQAAANSFEAEAVSHFCRQLLFTVEVLRMKYTYHSSERHSLWVDLSESGFPNSAEIEALEVDLETAAERLHDLPAASLLKRALLDELVEHRQDPFGLLCTLSERTYLEMLKEEALYLPVTRGELRSNKNGGRDRQYVYAWGCYDFETNRPFFHVMTCEQEAQAEPLEEQGESFQKFMDAVKGVGGRAPSVGVLALSLDEALERVHPKILKRICVGPLYSNLLFSGREVNGGDAREAALREMLSDASDFVLFFSDEVVFSKRQEISRSLFSPLGKVRQIFAIEESDPECYARRASVVHDYVLLPHRLLQRLTPAQQESIPGFAKCRKFAFDERGEVHGV